MCKICHCTNKSNLHQLECIVNEFYFYENQLEGCEKNNKLLYLVLKTLSTMTQNSIDV